LSQTENNGQRAGYRYQMSDLRCQREEDRDPVFAPSELRPGRRRADVRGQMSEVRGQMSEVRCQRTGLRSTVVELGPGRQAGQEDSRIQGFQGSR